MKRSFHLVLLWIISCVPLVHAFEDELIEALCKRKQNFDEAIKGYIQIEERKVTILDEKGQKVKEEFTISEISWNNGNWSRKILKKISKGIVTEPMSVKIEKEKKIRFPFDLKDRFYYNYAIKENKDHIIIKAYLKPEYKGIKALEGEFVISNKTKYIDKAFLTLRKFLWLLEPTKITITYSQIDENLILPVKVESITTSKKIFGIQRHAITESKFTYKKRGINVD